MPDPTQKPRFIEGKDVIYACRGNGWASWAMELLDLAYKAECKLRRTNTHHVMISNDVGDTTTLAGRNSSSGARSKRDVMKVIDAQTEYRLKQKVAAEPVPVPPVPVPPPVQPAEVVSPPPEPEPELTVDVTPKPFCPLHDEPIYFDTERKLENHRKSAGHWKCPRPGCGDWLKSSKSAGGHIGIAHGTSKPWEAKANFKGKHPAPSGSVSELIDNVRRGTVTTGKKAKALFPEPPKVNSNGTRKSGPTKTVELPEPGDPKLTPGSGQYVTGPNRKLDQIRQILGEDPRVAELTRERDDWKRRAEDAETKIEMMRSHARQLSEAADL